MCAKSPYFPIDFILWLGLAADAVAAAFGGLGLNKVTERRLHRKIINIPKRTKSAGVYENDFIS